MERHSSLGLNDNVVFHVWRRHALVTDKDYPQRVAFDLLHRICNQPDQTNALVAQYAHPLDADRLSRIQHEVREAVLRRGETLDDLVARSHELSQTTHHFYRSAKCCKLY